MLFVVIPVLLLVEQIASLENQANSIWNSSPHHVLTGGLFKDDKNETSHEAELGSGPPGTYDIHRPSIPQYGNHFGHPNVGSRNHPYGSNYGQNVPLDNRVDDPRYRQNVNAYNPNYGNLNPNTYNYGNSLGNYIPNGYNYGNTLDNHIPNSYNYGNSLINHNANNYRNTGYVNPNSYNYGDSLRRDNPNNFNYGNSLNPNYGNGYNRQYEVTQTPQPNGYSRPIGFQNYQSNGVPYLNQQYDGRENVDRTWNPYFRPDPYNFRNQGRFTPQGVYSNGNYWNGPNGRPLDRGYRRPYPQDQWRPNTDPRYQQDYPFSNTAPIQFTNRK